MLTTTTRKNNAGFSIGVGCPGCGGELELADDFFVVGCSHCGSVLRLVMPDMPVAWMVVADVPKSELRFHIDRYLKTSNLPLTGGNLMIKSVYYPYWKVDGHLLRVRNKIEKRVIVSDDAYAGGGYDGGTPTEVTSETRKTEIRVSPYNLTVAAATTMDGVPASIGMRTQYIKLLPFTAERIAEDFDSLTITRPLDEISDTVNRSIKTIGNIQMADFGKNRTELYHPTFAIVYYPYHVVETYDEGRRRFVVDGATGTVMEPGREGFGTLSDAPDSESGPPPNITFGKLDVVFHRCANCGIDLPDDKSVVYICRNCQSVASIEPGHPVSEISFAADPTKHAPQFPFWALKMPEVSQGMIRQMFGGMYRSEWMVIPAFRMPDFEAMFRLAKRMSVAKPQFDLGGLERFDERFRSASLPLSEAKVLANIIIHRRMIESRSAAIGPDKAIDDFHPTDVKLFYVPFAPQSYFYVDTIINAITFEKRQGDLA